jgi:hypothetical protein
MNAFLLRPRHQAEDLTGVEFAIRYPQDRAGGSDAEETVVQHGFLLWADDFDNDARETGKSSVVGQENIAAGKRRGR